VDPYEHLGDKQQLYFIQAPYSIRESPDDLLRRYDDEYAYNTYEDVSRISRRRQKVHGKVSKRLEYGVCRGTGKMAARLFGSVQYYWYKQHRFAETTLNAMKPA
jgi:hypothetical protein